MTLGVAFLLLTWFETQNNKIVDALEVFGSAPMFFYIVHLYVLLAGYLVLLAIFGPNHGELYGVDQFYWVWVTSALMTLLLYFPTKAFAQFKHSTNMAWVKYF